MKDWRDQKTFLLWERQGLRLRFSEKKDRGKWGLSWLFEKRLKFCRVTGQIGTIYSTASGCVLFLAVENFSNSLDSLRLCITQISQGTYLPWPLGEWYPSLQRTWTRKSQNRKEKKNARYENVKIYICICKSAKKFSPCPLFSSPTPTYRIIHHPTPHVARSERRNRDVPSWAWQLCSRNEI